LLCCFERREGRGVSVSGREGRGVGGREGRGVSGREERERNMREPRLERLRMVGEGVEKNGVKARVDAAWY
jgi:hypothetical protein